MYQLTAKIASLEVLMSNVYQPGQLTITNTLYMSEKEKSYHKEYYSVLLWSEAAGIGEKDDTLSSFIAEEYVLDEVIGSDMLLTMLSNLLRAWTLAPENSMPRGYGRQETNTDSDMVRIRQIGLIDEFSNYIHNIRQNNGRLGGE